jgi:hypothetical protein
MNGSRFSYAVYVLRILGYPFGSAETRFMDYAVGRPEKSIDVYEVSGWQDEAIDSVAHAALWLNLLIALAFPILVFLAFIRSDEK